MRRMIYGLVLASTVLTLPAVAARRNDSAALLAEAKKADAAGDTKLALAKAEAAAAAARTAGDLPALAAALEPLADYRATIDMAGTETALRELLAVKAKLPPGDPFELDEIHISVAVTRLEQNDKVAGLAMMRAAADAMDRHAHTPKQSQTAAIARVFIAQQLINVGDIAVLGDALALADRRLRSVLEPPSYEVAVGLTNLADLLLDGGRYPEAAALAELGLEVRGKVQVANHPLFVDPLGVAGDANLRLGRYDKAEALFRRAVEIADSSTLIQPAVIGRAYQNIGRFYSQINRPERALLMYRRGAVLGKGSPQYAAQLHIDAASAADDAGDPEAARTEVDQAIAATANPKVAAGLLGTAQLVSALLYLKAGNLPAATSAAEAARVNYAATYEAAHPRQSDPVAMLAAIRAAANDHRAAAALYDKAVAAMAARSGTNRALITAQARAAREHLRAGDPPRSAYGLARRAASALADLQVAQARLPIAGSAGDPGGVFDVAIDAGWASRPR